jgi:predicted esterase
LLEEDADLDGLRNLAELRAILDECAARYRDAQSGARPLCTVLSPSSALWEQQALVLLHMRGGSGAEFRAQWLPLVDDGWTLVSLQSSQPFRSGGFCWDDAELGRREILEQMDECRRVRGIDFGRVVMVGASQGARMAFEVTQQMAVPWLCVIPTFPAGYDSAPFIASRSRDRGAFILGAEDPANDRTRQLVISLQAAGAEVRTHSMPGTSHELPDDLPSLAREALDWLRAVGRSARYG